MTKRCAVLFVVLGLVVGGPCRDAGALDLNEWVNGLRVTPFLTERVEYQANVFGSPSHARDDVIFRTIPGFIVDYGRSANSLSFGYRAEILEFLDMSDQDRVHHFVSADLRLEFGRLRLGAREDFAKTSDPPNTELTGRVESTTNALAPEAEFRLTDRFAIGANTGWYHASFPTIPELSRDEYVAGASVFWKVLPKSDLLLTYNYGQKIFDSASNRDVSRQVILAGVRGELTAKLSSRFRLGYEVREPKHAGAAGYHGVVGGGEWVYTPTERLRIALITDRSVQESFERTSLFYVSTIGTLAVDQQFTSKLTAGLRATAGVNKYPSKDTFGGRADFRNDKLFGWGALIGYDVQKWLRVAADYSHFMRDSNIPDFSYKDDRIGLVVTVQL